MDITFIIIGVSIVFVLVLWAAVGVRHLRSGNKKVRGSWEFTDEKIRERHDAVPLMIEICGGGSVPGTPGATAQDLIAIRNVARRIYRASEEKVEKEKELGKVLTAFVLQHGKTEEMKKNQLFLEALGNLKGLKREIVGRSREYNEVAVRFNKHRGFFLLKPLAGVFRIRQAGKFEFGVDGE
jgi:hypothetical protein